MLSLDAVVAEFEFCPILAEYRIGESIKDESTIAFKTRNKRGVESN